MADDELPAGRGSGDESGTIRATYDWAAISPSIAVIETVAAATGHEPMKLESLYDQIDPDALDSLFRRTGENPAPSEVQLSFPYDGHDVTVRSDGVVKVQLDQ